jgi:hypothetical protein
MQIIRSRTGFKSRIDCKRALPGFKPLLGAFNVQFKSQRRFCTAGFAAYIHYVSI